MGCTGECLRMVGRSSRLGTGLSVGGSPLTGLPEAVRLRDVSRKGVEGPRFRQDGGKGGLDLEFVELGEELDALVPKVPTKQNKMLSSLGLGTSWAVRVVNRVDAVQECGQRGVPGPKLGYGCGSVSGEVR